MSRRASITPALKIGRKVPPSKTKLTIKYPPKVHDIFKIIILKLKKFKKRYVEKEKELWYHLD
ncbi:hypothetical protein UT300017_12150 [Clostridium sp. CTA-17]